MSFGPANAISRPRKRPVPRRNGDKPRQPWQGVLDTVREKTKTREQRGADEATAALRSELASYRKANKDLKKEIHELRRRNKQNEVAVSKNNDAQAVLQKQVKSAQTLAGEIRFRLIALEKANSVLKQQIAKKEKHIDRLEREVQDERLLRLKMSGDTPGEAFGSGDEDGLRSQLEASLQQRMHEKRRYNKIEVELERLRDDNRVLRNKLEGRMLTSPEHEYPPPIGNPLEVLPPITSPEKQVEAKCAPAAKNHDADVTPIKEVSILGVTGIFSKVNGIYVTVSDGSETSLPVYAKESKSTLDEPNLYLFADDPEGLPLWIISEQPHGVEDDPNDPMKMLAFVPAISPVPWDCPGPWRYRDNNGEFIPDDNIKCTIGQSTAARTEKRLQKKIDPSASASAAQVLRDTRAALLGFRKKKESVTKMQAAFRMWKARKSYLAYSRKRSEAATIIQTAARKRQERHKMATKLQANYRGHLVRKGWIRQQEERVKAASVIQRNIRENHSQRVAAATKLQAHYRGKITRQQYNENLIQRRETAARLIQKNARGLKGRKEALDRRAEKLNEEERKLRVKGGLEENMQAQMAGALPIGWRVRLDIDSGFPYFFNDNTGESSWSFPSESLEGEVEARNLEDSSIENRGEPPVLKT